MEAQLSTLTENHEERIGVLEVELEASKKGSHREVDQLQRMIQGE